MLWLGSQIDGGEDFGVALTVVLTRLRYGDTYSSGSKLGEIK